MCFSDSDVLSCFRNCSLFARNRDHLLRVSSGKLDFPNHFYFILHWKLGQLCNPLPSLLFKGRDDLPLSKKKFMKRMISECYRKMNMRIRLIVKLQIADDFKNIFCRGQIAFKRGSNKTLLTLLNYQHNWVKAGLTGKSDHVSVCLLSEIKYLHEWTPIGCTLSTPESPTHFAKLTLL